MDPDLWGGLVLLALVLFLLYLWTGLPLPRGLVDLLWPEEDGDD